MMLVNSVDVAEAVVVDSVLAVVVDNALAVAVDSVLAVVLDIVLDSVLAAVSTALAASIAGGEVLAELSSSLAQKGDYLRGMDCPCTLQGSLFKK
jgi:hypothetical protein